MSLSLFYQGISLQNQRPSNMDSVLLSQQELEGQSLGLFAVCDGVGSSRFGGEVAQYLVEGLEDWFFAQKHPRHLGIKLSQELFRLNKKTLQWLGEENGQSTLTAMLVTPKKIFFAHAGDSRIYQRQGQKPWLLQSTDHCDQEGLLLDYMGKKSRLTIDCWDLPTQGAEFLLCTDGFYRKQDWELTSRALSSCGDGHLRQTLEDLAQHVITKGEKDNISALFCRVELSK